MTKRHYILSVIACAALVLAPGCTTTDSYGNPVPDTAKNAKIAAGLKLIVAETVAPIVRNNVRVAPYLHQVAAVFCRMKTDGRFSPIQLRDTLNLIPIPPDISPAVTSIKNALLGIYEATYNGNIDIVLDPQKFGGMIAEAACDGIATGLIDSGH